MSLNDNTEKDKVIEKITRWLSEENCSIEDKSNQSNQYTYYFGLVKKKDEPIGIRINIPKNSVDKVLVGTRVAFKEIDKIAYIGIYQRAKRMNSSRV